METGNLILQAVSAEGAILIANAAVTLTDENNNVLHQLTTDNTGHAPEISLPAPDAALTEDPHAHQKRYSLYNAVINAKGYTTAEYRGIMIFGQTTSILVINMHPAVQNERYAVEVMDIGGHALDDPQMPGQQPPQPPMPRILPEVIIPNHITVHLGNENSNAANVRVPFID